MPDIKKCGLLGDLLCWSKKLVQNVYSLTLNMTKNTAKTYNFVMNKFIGKNKQIF